MKLKERHWRRLCGAVAVMVVALAVVWLLLPRPELYSATTFSSAVYDRDGRLLRLQLAADQRYRLFVPLNDIAPVLIDATLLYEDRHFYQHPGVNAGALIRAGWTTYVKRTRRMGASTLSMQLARLRFDLHTRTVGGKLVQIFRALQLERHYTKDDILEAYLNLAPYGGNVEGIGTASLIYFDKPAADLTLAEALALAVVPQNPARRAPSRRAKLPALYDARGRLLASWAQEHEVTEAQQALMKLPLQVRHTNQLPFHAPHLSQWFDVHRPHSAFTTSVSTSVVEESRSAAIAHASTVRTSLSLPLQMAFEHTIDRFLEQRHHEGLSNASAMLVDTRTMQVLASIGSADFNNVLINGQVDGTRAKRSPGSTLKPFVYGLAMDQGLIHPNSLLSDAPRRFGVYTPENFDRGFKGPVLATDALIYSRNVPAIELLNRLGQERFHQLLLSASVTGLKSAEHYGLSMVLGGNELTMEELVKLYAMLANRGLWQELNYTAEPAPTRATRLLSPEASFLTLDMLRQNPPPNALTVTPTTQRTPVAWKTGTSYAYRDAWTVGVTGPYVLAVWVGHFDGRSNPSLIGRRAAAPLFFDLVSTLSASAHVANPADRQAFATHHLPDADLNLTRVAMCSGTGDLPNRDCPMTEDGWFIPGVSPIKISNVYRSVEINPETGLRACLPSRTNIAQTFEFWPSDVARLLRQAGISLQRPPPYEAHCPQNVMAAKGIAPSITSPAPKLTYQIRPGHEEAPLPLTANTDADVSSLFWFVDNRFIAEVQRDEPLLWTPTPGRYDISVVDDLGRSDMREYRFETVQ